MNQVRGHIIVKLRRKVYWCCSRPINFDDLKNPKFPNKDLKKELKAMVKEGLLMKKPGKFGERYGLNPHKSKEIEKLYEQALRI